MTLAGLAIGLVLAVVAARSMGALLYGFQPRDVPTAVVVSMILLAVAAFCVFTFRHVVPRAWTGGRTAE